MSDERLRFLLEVVQLETTHLRDTDARLFAAPFDVPRAAGLRRNIDDAERTDAFVARFARLQDTLGDKLLPVLLAWLLEPVGAVIDNLDRAEKLGLVESADAWVAARALRNRMVHEYVRDPAMLADALNEGHRLVALLTGTTRAFVDECARRGLVVVPAA